jgi:hypothetical protein
LNEIALRTADFAARFLTTTTFGDAPGTSRFRASQLEVNQQLTVTDGFPARSTAIGERQLLSQCRLAFGNRV